LNRAFFRGHSSREKEKKTKKARKRVTRASQKKQGFGPKKGRKAKEKFTTQHRQVRKKQIQKRGYPRSGGLLTDKAKKKKMAQKASSKQNAKKKERAVSTAATPTRLGVGWFTHKKTIQKARGGIPKTGKITKPQKPKIEPWHVWEKSSDSSTGDPTGATCTGRVFHRG